MVDGEDVRQRHSTHEGRVLCGNWSYLTDDLAFFSVHAAWQAVLRSLEKARLDVLRCE
jgi:hypothetical protein